jgi:predicted Abi (CAAX) family protease
MGELNRSFWELASGAMRLDAEAYLHIHQLSFGLTIALLIVLIAGISQTLGQCIVLFVNRVRPVRFLYSLLVSGLLFVCTFLFWGLSIEVVTRFLFHAPPHLLSTFRTLGLSYAPQMLGFLIALPHFGIPISVLLSIWSLLSLVSGIRGLEELSGFGVWQALLAAGLGWIILQVLQRTVGRPVMAVGQSLLDWASGTQMVQGRDELRQLIEEGRVQHPAPPSSTENLSWIETTKELQPKLIWQSRKAWAIAAIVFILASALLTAFREDISIWYATLSETVTFTLNLITIGGIAIMIATFLTPLESLGWWAGWYGDDTLVYHGEQLEEIPDELKADRYVMYLDGINQGSHTYLPEVDHFLVELAKALPDNIRVIRGIMPYSVRNRSLGEGAPLAFVWRIVDSLTARHPNNPIAFFINLRNVVAVAVSADPRYGPIQNQGLAQVLFDSLVHHGYVPGSKIPISLIGHSGGGQMSMGAASYLKKATQAPVEVISVAGVISGNVGAMDVEHLFHLVGEKDVVEKLGPMMFPDRWPIAVLSVWNQAKRRGRMSLISLGEIGHNGLTGPFAADAYLPDGRSFLQQTLDLVAGILLKNWTLTGFDISEFIQPSNYERYMNAAMNQPSSYPTLQQLPGDRYQPIGRWMGRLILPTVEERENPRFVWFEVYHAPADHSSLIGQTTKLTWSQDADVTPYVQLVTQDVVFVDQVRASQRQGNVHPERINYWSKVDPLESLAGAHPSDDVVVMLPDSIEVHDPLDSSKTTLKIHRDPIQISGRYYALVQFMNALENETFQVRHYNRASRQFDGAEEIILMPNVIADRNGVFSSTSQDIERSPCNPSGWYIYGAYNHAGQFMVQAIAPRSLFSLQADQMRAGKRDTLHHINYDYWKDVVAQKGTLSRTLLCPDSEPAPSDPRETIEQRYQVGDRLLLMHVYGGIGGHRAEFSPMGLFFGHFAYGVARVVHEPLADEKQFSIEYRQIYTHNPDGIIAGTLHWTRYMGDRQFGWLGTRPTSDILIKFPPLTEDYEFDGITFSPFDTLVRELDVMAARYRTGDGTGTTFVSPVNSCVQDASQALYVSLKRIVAQIQLNPLILKWLRENREHPQAQRFMQLASLVKTIETTLTPLGFVRSDWEHSKPTLGGFPVETPMKTILFTLSSWRSLLPRLANDLIAMVFLQLGATVWVLRTNQIGGNDPDIEPIAPTDFSFEVPKLQKIKEQL